MATNKKDKIRAERRALRVKSRLKKGTSQVPRISVFRSLKHIYVQFIDDIQGTTLISSSSHIVQKDGSKKDVAFEVGLDVAKKAQEKGIQMAVFDRGKYRYLGRTKALAEGVRQGGIQF